MTQTEAQKRAQKKYVFHPRNHWRYKRNYRIWQVKNLDYHRETSKEGMRQIRAKRRLLGELKRIVNIKQQYEQ